MKLIQGAIVPDKSLDFNEQIEDICLKLKEWLIQNELSVNQIVSSNIFIKFKSKIDFLEARKLIEKELAENFGVTFPVAYLSQSPAEGHEIIWEIHALPKTGYIEFHHKNIDNCPYIVLIDSENTRYLFVTGIEDLDSSNNILLNSDIVFRKIEAILTNEKMEFSAVLRQWNYIENIGNELQTIDGIQQHYQIFNDIRSKYYQKSCFTNGYPAATGIGTNAGGIIISFYAVEQTSKTQIYPIDNPLQVSAFNYTNEKLIGAAIDKTVGKASPKFVRAKYVKDFLGETIFISGTASIRGEETVAIGDVLIQTQVTLENIESLISLENLVKSNINLFNQTPVVTFLRVYIKEIKDSNYVLKICQDKYPGIPLILVQSDICRNNLLVEIEGAVGFRNLESFR